MECQQQPSIDNDFEDGTYGPWEPFSPLDDVKWQIVNWYNWTSSRNYYPDINPQTPKPNGPGSSFLQLIRKKEKTFSVVQLETNNYFTVAQNDTIQFACWIQSKFKKFNNIEVIYLFNEITFTVLNGL